MALVVFILFSYTELQSKAGIYLFRRGITVTSSVLLVANVGATYFSIKPLVVLKFLALNILMLLTDEKYSDDTKVIMRPCEKEVRVKKGKEHNLVNKLKIQYKDSIQKTFPSSVKTNEISRAVCNDVNKKYPTPICFNSEEKAECMDMHMKAETTMTSPFHGLSSMLGSSVWWRLLVLLLCITPTVLSYRMCPVCPPPAGVQRRTTSWLGVHQVISLLMHLLL